MGPHLSRRGPVLALWVLAGLVPLYHLYSYHALSGAVQARPGLIQVATFAVALALFVDYLKERESDRLVTCVTALMLSYITLYISVAFLVGHEGVHEADASLFKYYLNTVFQNGLYFLIGLRILGLERHRTLVQLLFALLVLNLILNFSPEAWAIDLSVIDLNQQGIYLFLGDSFVLWAALTFAVTQTTGARLAIILVSLPVSFCFYTRTAFYVQVLLTPLLLWIAFNRRFLPLLLVLGGFLGISVYVAITALPLEQIAEMRMLSWVITGEDSSVANRLVELDQGLRTISKHWLFGDYGSDLRDFREPGHYIHGYLEMWRQFGVFPFALFVLLVLVYAKELVTWLISGTDDVANVALHATMLLSLVEALFSRSYGYPFLFFSIGLLAAMRGIRGNGLLVRRIDVAVAKPS